MGQPDRSLTSLGRHVAALQDRSPEARLDRMRGRARFLRETVARRERPRPWGRALAAALAAAVLAALAVVLVGRSPAPLRFDVGPAPAGVAQAGAVGEWIAAPPGAALPIRFSDGSELRLAPGGRARVASVSADGAEIALERGSLDLAVVHRDRTRWRVRVGPFQVQVTGTRFDASWDPVTERCTVTLREGAITVSGPVVGDARRMRAGERLVISPAAGTLEATTIDASGAPDPSTPGAFAPGAVSPGAQDAPATGGAVTGDAAAGGDAAGGDAANGGVAAGGAGAASGAGAGGGAAANAGSAGNGGVAPGGDPASRASPGAGGDASPAAGQGASPSASGKGAPATTWRALARDGKYKDALAAAESEGFDVICGSASAADLYALADVARLGGDAARASKAFGALRTRFPASPEAASAAFIQGRIAQDRQKDPAAAAAWFTRYLSEQPSGAFAADAAGRLVEALDRAGDAAGARRAAQRYLAAYPGGTHSGYAKRVLARDAAPGGSARPAPDGGAGPAPGGSAVPAPGGSAVPAPGGSARPAPGGDRTGAGAGTP